MRIYRNFCVFLPLLYLQLPFVSTNRLCTYKMQVPLPTKEFKIISAWWGGRCWNYRISSHAVYSRSFFARSSGSIVCRYSKNVFFIAQPPLPVFSAYVGTLALNCTCSFLQKGFILQYFLCNRKIPKNRCEANTVFLDMFLGTFWAFNGPLAIAQKGHK